MVNDNSLAQAFAHVARTLQAQDTAERTLQRVVELAQQTVPGCEHAGISWVQGGSVRTPASTGPVPVTVDRIQYETDQGPCLSAVRQDQTQEAVEPVEAVDLLTEVRWPAFTARAVVETGVRSMLSFQLHVQDRVQDRVQRGGRDGVREGVNGAKQQVLGALNLYASTAGAFERDSLVIGEVFAGHAAVALAAAVTRDEALRTRQDLDLSAARTAELVERVVLGAVLQASMLTDLEALPQPDHLELAALYRPAAAEHEVGGDWYDAFVLPDGATAVVIGDVSGHDAGAAATMGALRSMLRALAWDRAGSPAQVLRRLDAAVAGLGMDAIASVVLARIEQGEADASAGVRTVRWASAGHLPPLLLDPQGGVQVLDAAGDLLLGVSSDVARHDHVVVVQPGSTLLLYTDGLVERRGEHLQLGIERLAGALAASEGLPLPDLLPALAGLVLTGGGVGGEDDTAALVVRMHLQH